MTPGDAHRVGVVRPRNPAILPLARLFLISLCLSALLRAWLPSHPADFGVYLCVLAPRPPRLRHIGLGRAAAVPPRRFPRR